MDKLLIALGSVVAVFGTIFLAVILGSLMGGVAGWIVGLFFADPILNILGQMGVHDVTMFQFGLFMGFVGGFFRSQLKSK